MTETLSNDYAIMAMLDKGQREEAAEALIERLKPLLQEALRLTEWINEIVSLEDS